MTTSTPGTQLAVLSQSGCTVSFFDLATGARTHLIDVLPEGHELCFDPDRRMLYASHTYSDGYYLVHEAKGHQISVIDVDTHEIVDVIDLGPEHAPHAMHLDTSTGTLFVSVEEGPAGPGGILALDPKTGQVTARFSAEAPIPHSAALTPDGRKVYTANKQAPYVSAIDTATGETRRIAVAGSEGIAASPEGSRVFVATPTIFAEGPHTVEVIDTATDDIVHSIPLTSAAGPVHVTTDGKLLVGRWGTTDPTVWGTFDATGEPRSRSGSLAIFDAKSYRPLGEVPIGIGPINITATPDATTAFVANLQSGTVTVADLHTYEVITTLEVDRGDHLSPDRTIPNQGAHGLALIPPAR